MPYFETIIDCGDISVTFNAVYFPFIDFLLVYFLVVTVAIVLDSMKTTTESSVHFKHHLN